MAVLAVVLFLLVTAAAILTAFPGDHGLTRLEFGAPKKARRS